MADVFLSYARENRSTASSIANNSLFRHGWTVFWDRNIHAGPRFEDVNGR